MPKPDRLDKFYREAYRRGVYFMTNVCADPLCTNCVQIGAPQEPPARFMEEARGRAYDIACLLRCEAASHA